MPARHTAGGEAVGGVRNRPQRRQAVRLAVEREGDVIHIMARSLESLDEHLAGTLRRSRDFH